jgi:hypothetical protein
MQMVQTSVHNNSHISIHTHRLATGRHASESWDPALPREAYKSSICSTSSQLRVRSVHTFRTSQKRKPGNLRKESAPVAAYIPTHAWSNSRVFFIVVAGFGLQRQMLLSRTPVCGPVHSDACRHAPAPPPAGCFHCQHVTRPFAREGPFTREGPRGMGTSRYRSGNVVKLATLSTPPQNHKPATIATAPAPL